MPQRYFQLQWRVGPGLASTSLEMSSNHGSSTETMPALPWRRMTCLNRRRFDPKTKMAWQSRVGEKRMLRFPGGPPVDGTLLRPAWGWESRCERPSMKRRHKKNGTSSQSRDWGPPTWGCIYFVTGHTRWPRLNAASPIKLMNVQLLPAPLLLLSLSVTHTYTMLWHV